MKQNTAPATPPWHHVRRTELDWLRVLAFGILIFYHVGMLYVAGWDWHYKSSYISSFLSNIMLWSNQWRMSLLFLISGVAVSYLLQSMSYWKFYRSRHSKVLLPLVFGMTVMVVPQVYVEMTSKGLTDSINYIDFWIAYLNPTSALFDRSKTIGSMHLTWNHLWFLMYIFSYSIILWVVYPLLNSQASKKFWLKVSERVPIWSIFVAPILCFFVLGELMWERFPTTHAFLGDWFNHAKSLLCFILGFALVRSNRLWGAFASFRWSALLGAIATYAYTLFAFNGGQLGECSFWGQVNGLLWSANAWLWIVTVIAWAQHKLTFTNAWLKYLNGGVYCFYILHQTAIIVIAYYLVPLQLGPTLEPLLVIGGTTFSCWAGYEICRRIPVIALLMGTKLKKQKPNEAGPLRIAEVS